MTKPKFIDAAEIVRRGGTLDPDDSVPYHPPSAPESETRLAPSSFRTDARGVHGSAYDKEIKGQRERWLCGPLQVLANVRDRQGGNWEYLLQLQTLERRPATVRMKHELFVGDWRPALALLKSAGLSMSSEPADQKLIRAYLEDAGRDASLARSVENAGWHADNAVFLAPDGRQWPEPGAGVERHLLDGKGATLARRGSLDAWRSQVAAKCIGNSRLVFAVSVAFAGPLLDVLKVPSGGFHFVGTSSEGKTTALEVAASVWGYPAADGVAAGVTKTWDATGNALTTLAAQHSDALLVLDEIGQADARSIGRTVYTLANGHGRERCAKDGSLSAAASLRLLFLSAGEKDLDAVLAEGGKLAKAGQDARLPSLPADAGAGFGLFEALHGATSPKAFAEALGRAVRDCHGVASEAWLKWLTSLDAEGRRQRTQAHAEAFHAAAAKALGGDVAGEVHRVVNRFALVAAAGELATEAGITGWPKGEASRAALFCLEGYLERRGGAGSKDKAALLSHVRGLFESQEARFEKPGDERSPHNRLGFLVTENDKRRAYVLPTVFQSEFVAGLAESPKTAVAWLVEAGWLVPGACETGRTKPRATHPKRLPNGGINRVSSSATRVYVFDLDAIGAGEEASRGD